MDRRDSSTGTWTNVTLNNTHADQMMPLGCCYGETYMQVWRCKKKHLKEAYLTRLLIGSIPKSFFSGIPRCFAQIYNVVGDIVRGWCLVHIVTNEMRVLHPGHIDGALQDV
jgi:hypothetical protein